MFSEIKPDQTRCARPSGRFFRQWAVCALVFAFPALLGARENNSVSPNDKPSSAAAASPTRWREKYAQAHRIKSLSQKRALALFREVADGGDPILANNALLQIALIYRIGLMEPRLALEVLDEFLARPTAPDHPAYERSKATQTHLRDALKRMEALERKLESPSPGDDPATVTLTAMAELYRTGLDAPNYAFQAYRQAFEVSSKTLDTACYMMAHCKMDMAEYVEAARLFEDFRKRFPQSPLYASSFDLGYRSKFLHVHALEWPLLQAPAAARLIAEIDRALAENPNLEPRVRERLLTLRRLSHKYLPEKKDARP